MYDLVLKGGRVVDPAQGIDSICDIAFSDGGVAAIDAGIDPSSAADTRMVDGLIVTPGLIDLHTHVYWGATSLGVRPEAVARRSGSTTLVDAGSAGAGNFAGLKEFMIEPAAVRILAYLNISFAGIFGSKQGDLVGECADLRLLDVAECVAAVQANRDLVVGIKVRLGRMAGGSSGLIPLDLALEVAEELDLPVMTHIDIPPPKRRDVLEKLRPGDILTHCFRPFPNSPVTKSGRMLPEMVAARERGVIFDVGHGVGSFSFAMARASLEQGYAPDVISSDVHVFSYDGPAFDVAVTMSKYLCLGMPFDDVVRAATAKPAEVMGRPELGSLALGSVGDAVAFRLEEGQFDYYDAVGEVLVGDRRLMPEVMVVGGRIWESDTAVN
jgi:dihydroorotase